MRPRLRRLVVAAAIVLVTAGTATGVVAAQSKAPQVATAAGYSLVRTANGLLASRPFSHPRANRVLLDNFEFNGSAHPKNAYVADRGGGLKVGMRPQDSPRFRGWFAVTLAAFPATSVFHVDMTRPPGNVTGAGRESEAVFAVQTASTKVTGLINFVEVSSDSLRGTSAWQVDYSHGLVRNAKSKLYWRSIQSTHAPLSHEITVRTDGAHALTVWFGNKVVFHSDALHMHMEAPFQPYLEVQSLRGPYVATFHDFWVARDASVVVRGLPRGAKATLESPRTGSPIASGAASASGTATLHLPPPRARGRAKLAVALPGGRHVTLGPFRYAGGDQYRLRAPSAPSG